MKLQSQAIVVREVASDGFGASPKPGVGQTPDVTYGQINAVLIQILGYFDTIVQQNPQDLTAPRMANLTTELMSLVQQYNSEVAAMLKSCSDKLAGCQATSAQASTALQQSQTEAASGVSPGAAAGIAIASALGGGALGYFVRAKMR